ncbi:MAG: hypothetical protein Q4F84_00460 [Fibrobacter sp.]|nr:hypothetical protein [Fibrobacter sp.]
MLRKHSLIFINVLAILLFACQNLTAMVPNPILSRGKDVVTSSGTVSYLTDNKFKNQFWNVTNDSWLAIHIGNGHQKLFVSFNDPNYAWASTPLAPDNCPNTGLAHLEDYDILVSQNSTDGKNGDWTTALQVTGNVVTSRGHKINSDNAEWVRIHVIKGSGVLDEIEVFDITNGSEDIWFFAGTSISANTYKGTPPVSNFADLVNAANSSFTPAMIRGGIGCQNSNVFVQNISTYLEMAKDAHFWAIEHGTNDAWGGYNGGAANFRRNLQTIIDSCKANGIEPILARVLATNETSAQWQVHQDYLTCIDELTKENNLIPGPDLFSWFKDNPQGLASDGVHPNEIGSAKIQELWAQKMDSLYNTVKVVQKRTPTSRLRNAKNIYRVCNNGKLVLEPKQSGSATVFSLCGKVVHRVQFSQNAMRQEKSVPDGVYIVKFSK